MVRWAWKEKIFAGWCVEFETEKSTSILKIDQRVNISMETEILQLITTRPDNPLHRARVNPGLLPIAEGHCLLFYLLYI